VLFSGRELHGILDSARHVKGEEKRTTVLTLIKLRRLRVVLGEALVDDVDLAWPLFSIVGRRGLSLPLGVLEAIDGTHKVPVVNWSRHNLRSTGHERHAKNHSITRSVILNPR